MELTFSAPKPKLGRVVEVENDLVRGKQLEPFCVERRHECFSTLRNNTPHQASTDHHREEHPGTKHRPSPHRISSKATLPSLHQNRKNGYHQ
jgi:hypothetical protein